MSIDSNLYLASNVRVQDVATVLAILHGHAANKNYLPKSNSFYVSTNGCKIKQIPNLYELLSITIEPTSLGSDSYFYNFHFESGSKKLLSSKYSKEIVEVLKKVADFFGGELCVRDNEVPSYCVSPNPDSVNCPEDGEEYDEFQKKVFNLKKVL